MQTPVQMQTMQSVRRIDWMPCFCSASGASNLCALLLVGQIGPMRATSRQVLSIVQPRFDARWRRLFPCPWSAAVGGEPTAEKDEESDRQEGQKRFEERINALERAMGAMANGDSRDFGEAAEALGPVALSMLNMASFCGPNNDRSLLHYAVIRCDLAAARWLLRHGASPNVKSHDTDLYGERDTSWTPLHHAARNGDVPTCKLLLAAGADVDALLTDPESGFGKDSDACFRSLRASGSCFYKSDFLGAGSSPTDIATRIGNTALAELLRTWPDGAPARARPSRIAPSIVSTMGPKVAAAVAAAVAENPMCAVLRPRHRHCQVPGPLVPMAK